MTTELATVDGEIVETRAPVTLFGTDNPGAVVERASTVATALGAVINERRLFASIGGKKHVQVEGWTLLGSMLGVFAEIEWSRPMEDGWEARAVARTLNGNVVGAAEAMCTTKEGRWRTADPYAVRSMAQTRAVSKALRMPLGFIMHLAGYSATPAEEMVEETQPERAEPVGRRSASAPASYRRQELAELAAAHDIGHQTLEQMASLIGIKSGTRATDEQMDALIDLVRGETVERIDAPEAGDATEPPVSVETGASGSPLSGAPPPQKGTPEYDLLPTGTERAAARAYWDRHEAEPEQVSLAAALGAPESAA